MEGVAVCLVLLGSFIVSNLIYVCDGSYREADKIILTYNHEKQFYVESSEFTGDLKCYKYTIPKRGRCLYVKSS
ncbi:hypothetical protein EB796_000711 [Bugula neritina]|uniref:Uncharacterized protein n=1 Tax=Bugula neritina TaxID=10212 RepID=A0A7J7KS44_BUGNE|nr:hypothetical protein EB796_000711 [Bugula neritina]